VVPFGAVGGWGFRLLRPAIERVIDRGLATLKERVETT
jgi:hypothetical protein